MGGIRRDGQNLPDVETAISITVFISGIADVRHRIIVAVSPLPNITQIDMSKIIEYSNTENVMWYPYSTSYRRL